METLGVLAIILLLIVIAYYMAVYNKLIKLRNGAKEAEAGIDIALLKRYDLISNLVETVKGYTKHESEVLDKLVKARLNLKGDKELADNQMDEVLTSINMSIEAYPDLKASEQFLNLQKNLSNVEEHLQASRRLFNANVRVYNDTIEQFPSSIIAKNHNFTLLNMFEVNKDLSKPELNL